MKRLLYLTELHRRLQACWESNPERIGAASIRYHFIRACTISATSLPIQYRTTNLTL